MTTSASSGSGTFQRESRRTAKEFPKVSFLFGSGAGPAEPNFGVFDNWIHEPAYLAGMLAGGLTTSNVIGESVRMTGTIRAVAENTRTRVHQGLKRVAENVARAHECAAEVEIYPGFPVTINEARAVALVEHAIRDELGQGAFVRSTAPVMGAEDFSYVLQKVPGAMAFLGVCPEGQDFRAACPCHSNKMEMSEAAMAHGVAAHCAMALNFLRDGLPG